LILYSAAGFPDGKWQTQLLDLMQKAASIGYLPLFFVFDGLRYFGLLRPELVTQREE
jgi:hypothetical protein